MDKLLSYVDKTPYFSSLNLNMSLGSHPFDWCEVKRKQRQLREMKKQISDDTACSYNFRNPVLRIPILLPGELQKKWNTAASYPKY